MAYPRFVRSRQFVKKRRTSGNLTLNSNLVWADVDTTLDLTLDEVQVGDELIFGVNSMTGPETVLAYFDVVTVVSGTVTNSFAARGTPGSPTPYVSAWRQADAGVITPLVGTAPPYTVVAGDLSNGSVTLRLRYYTGSAANKTMYAGTANPLDVWAMNLGPAQG